MQLAQSLLDLELGKWVLGISLTDNKLMFYFLELFHVSISLYPTA